MTAIAEAKEALRRLEDDFTERLQRFEDETGLKVGHLDLEHTDVTTGQDQHRRFLVRVKPRAEVVR